MIGRSWNDRLRILPWVALATLINAIVAIQPVAGQPPATTAARADSSKPADVAAPAPPVDPLGGLESFPYIIVAPADSLKPFDENGTVIIRKDSLEEWKQSQIAQLRKKDSTTPLSVVQLDVELNSDSARIRAQFAFRVDSASGGWVLLDSREAVLQDVSIREQVAAPADIGGVRETDPWVPPVRLEGEGFAVRVDRAGAYICTLDLRPTVSAAPLGASLRLTLPLATVVRAKVSSPHPLALLRGDEPNEDYALSNEGRSAELSLRPAEPLVLLWRSANRNANVASIASVEGLTVARIDNGGVQIDASLDVTPTGEIRQLDLRLPRDAAVLDVLPSKADQPLPHELEIVDESDFKRLTLHLGGSVSGPFRVRVRTEIPRDSTGKDKSGSSSKDIAIQVAQVEGARQQSGTVLLNWSTGLWVRPIVRNSLQRVSVNDLPAVARGLQPRQAYSYPTIPASMDLRIEDARPTLSVLADHDLRVESEKAELTSQFRLSIRGAQTDSFTFRVPKQLRVTETSPAAVVGVADRASSDAADVRLLIVTLAEPVQDADFELSIRGELPAKAGSTNSLLLPTLEPDRFVRGSLTVRAEPGVRLSLDDSGSEYLRREAIPDEGIQEPPPYWFFRLQSGPSRLVYSAEVLPLRLEASVDTELRRSGQEIDVRSFLRFRAEHSTFDEIALSIPEGIDNLQLTGDLLPEDPPVRPGSVLLRLRNPTRASEVRAAYRYRMAESQPNEARIPLVQPRAAALTSWKGRVFCDRGWRAAPLDPWLGQRPAPSSLLTAGERLDLDLRPPSLESIPGQLGLRFEQTAMLATLVIPRVVVEEIVAGEGRRWGRKRWLITRHRTRDVTFRMPVDCRYLDAIVDGASVAAVAGGNREFRVRLPSTDGSCTLDISYDFLNWNIEGAVSFQRLDGPSLVEDAAVEQVRWILHVPEDRLLARVGSSENPGLAWQFPGFLQAKTTVGREVSPTQWLREIDPRSIWDARGVVDQPGRTWEFETFGNATTLQLVSLREPFWVLVCSGTSFIVLLALTRLSPMAQVRVGAVLALVVVGLLAATPNIASWLWLGAQWGIYLGIAAAAIHYWLLYRRLRAYSVGLRRFNARQLGFGSSILRRFDPKTRVTSTSGARQA